MRSLLTNYCHRGRCQEGCPSSSSRAIIEDMKIVIMNPVQNFVSAGVWRQEWIQSSECPLKSPRIIEVGNGLMSEGSNEFCWLVVLGKQTLYSSSHVEIVVFSRIERISMPAFQNECSFSKTMSVRMKIKSPPPRILLQSFNSVTYLLTNGVL